MGIINSKKSNISGISSQEESSHQASSPTISELYHEEVVANKENDDCNVSAITAPSTVFYPDLLDQSTAIELTHLRRLVLGIAGHVTNLGNESNVMHEKIKEMKKNLSKADFGLIELRRIQLESIYKMTQFSTEEMGVQVNANDPSFQRSEKEIQTRSIEEILIIYTAVKLGLHRKSRHRLDQANSQESLEKNSKPSVDDLDLTIEQIQSVLSVIASSQRDLSSQENEATVKAVGKKSQITNAKSSTTTATSDPSKAHSSPSQHSLDNREKEIPIPWFGETRSRNKFLEKLALEQSCKSYRSTAVILTISSLILLICLAFLITFAMDLKRHVMELRDRAEVVNNIRSVLHCPVIEPPENGSVKCDGKRNDKDEYSPDSICRFSCLDFHRLFGSKETKCVHGGNWDEKTPTCVYTKCTEVQDRDCASLFLSGKAEKTGIYTLVNCRTFAPYQVRCDANTKGGGWTVIQIRQNGKTNFTYSYEEYAQHFGDAKSEYWLGLENLHFITYAVNQSLKVEMTDWFYPTYHNHTSSAFYNNFKVEGADAGYRLGVTEFQIEHIGSAEDAGDSMATSNSMQFTAFDSDRDMNPDGNCAVITTSAWWHRNCTDANLNAVFKEEPSYGKTAIYWRTWRAHASLKSVRMMMRPRDWLKRN